MTRDVLLDLPKRHAAGDRVRDDLRLLGTSDRHRGRAAPGRGPRSPVLIEATCNQVNHQGGYTGMTPADFRAFVERIADKVGFARDRSCSAATISARTRGRTCPPRRRWPRREMMIAAFVEAGFTKLHLDSLDGLRRRARGAARRHHRRTRRAPCRGRRGSREGRAFDAGLHRRHRGPGAGRRARRPRPTAAVTTPEAVAETSRFTAGRLPPPGWTTPSPGSSASSSSLASSSATTDVIRLRAGEGPRARRRSLPTCRSSSSRRIQPTTRREAAWPPWSANGFAILKVGPGLTFALREALYGLDHIAADLEGRPGAVELHACNGAS